MHPLSFSLPELSDSSMWIVVGASGLIGLYLIMRPKKNKEATHAVPKFTPSRQRQVEDQMSNLIVELSKMAREITAQLDTRAAKLELLINEADEKISALHAVLRHPPNDRQANQAAEWTPRTTSSPEREIDDAQLANDPGSRKPIPNPMPPADSRHAEIYALAKQGRSAQDIAKLLTRPTGEIELILALRPR